MTLHRTAATRRTGDEPMLRPAMRAAAPVGQRQYPDLVDMDLREPTPRTSEPKPWIGVRFTCAPAYVRVTIDRAGDGYTARCPRCNKCMRFRVGSDGTNRRLFDVSC